jgi:50S ribosomal protein L16 3-hydroxylase
VTWSIGFRAPSHQELLDAYLDQLRDTVEIAGRYSDPKRGLVEVPAYIDPSLRRKLAAGISSVLDSASTPQALGKFIGEYLTAAKSHVEFMPPTPHRSLSQFSRLAAKRGLGLDLRSRMLFDDAHTYLNGRTMSFDSTPTAHQHSQLKTLANSRCLNAPQLDPQIIRQLYPYWTSGELEILE